MDMSQPAILLVGTAHFAGATSDAYTASLDDVLTPHRQQEMQACSESLAAFAPTHILVEASNQRQLNERYQAYRQGTYQLQANEIDQLAYRIAARVNHQQLYGVDWQDEREFDLASTLQFAQAHGQGDLADEIAAEFQSLVEEINASFHTHTIREFLRMLNAPPLLERAYRPYLHLARITANNLYPGGRLTANFYQRNLNIFANIYQVAYEANARALVMMEAGHIPWLRHIFAQSGDWTLISPILYL
jgi:hypothetical protein